MWWSFPDLIMTRLSAFFVTLHHCRACTKRSRCPSLWEGRLSHSSAQTRYNSKYFLLLTFCNCLSVFVNVSHFAGRGQAEGALPVQGLEATHPHHVQGLWHAQDWGSVPGGAQVNLTSNYTSYWEFLLLPTKLKYATYHNMFWQEGVPETCTSEGYSCDRHDHYQGISSLERLSKLLPSVQFFMNNEVSSRVVFTNFNEAWIVNIFQGQQDLQEVVNHWKQVNLQKTISISISNQCQYWWKSKSIFTVSGHPHHGEVVPRGQYRGEAQRLHFQIPHWGGVEMSLNRKTWVEFIQWSGK